MASIIIEQETKIRDSLSQLAASECKNSKLQTEKNALKKQIIQMEKKIKELEVKDPYQIYRNQGNSTLIEDLRREVDIKSKEANHLSQELILKERLIQEKDSKIKLLQASMIEQQATFEQERVKFKEKIREKREELLQLQSSSSIHQKRSLLKRGFTNYYQNKEKANSPLLQKSQDLHISSIIQEKKSSQVIDVQKRRAPVVGKSEIQPIFANLKYKFRSLGLSLDDLDGLMFPLSFWQHFSSEEEASVRIVELIGMLSSYPFQLGEDDSELVARYLVEDNDEGFVLVDWDLSTKVARVRSILRNLMQNYDLFKDRDEIESEIAKLMNKQLLLDHLNRLPSSASGICSQQEFFETLLYLDLQLPGRFQEYLCQKNYEMTDSITDFHFNKLVDYFCSI